MGDPDSQKNVKAMLETAMYLQDGTVLDQQLIKQHGKRAAELWKHHVVLME